MKSGVEGLLYGIKDGITGVLTKPLGGALTGGAQGLFNGLVMGAVGVVTKPVIGIFDFASATSAAIRCVSCAYHNTFAALYSHFC
jgi:vacuolar protein sorting-associated protein 13A/C